MTSLPNYMSALRCIGQALQSRQIEVFEFASDSGEFHLQCTEHPITVWAGVILLRLYFEWIKLREELNQALVGFAKRSNNQISSVDVMLSWYYGLALGTERFEHFTRYRRERLMRFSLTRMRPILMGHTLDLDSTILCRYGEQEGSLKGYNPKKPGRPSHHRLVAFLAEGRRLLWATLRSGNSGSANGCVEFLKQALTVLPDGQRIGLVRADAGFFEKRLLEYLESQELTYIIMARLTGIGRKLVIHQIPAATCRTVARGIEVAHIEASLPNWKMMKRRFICLRQEISERPEASGRRLIDCPGYTYRVMVTSVPYAAEMVTRMYAAGPTARTGSRNHLLPALRVVSDCPPHHARLVIDFRQDQKRPDGIRNPAG